MAWDKFVELYSRPILSAIKHTLRKHRIRLEQGYKTGLEDDIFHDIFIALIESNFCVLRGFKGKNGCRLASFLRIYASHRAIDYLNKIKLTSLDVAETKKPASCEERDQKKKIIAALSVAPDISFFKDQEIGLANLLEHLDSEERYFVQIAFLSELTSQEGAQKLGLTVGAYDMRRKRIKEKLRLIAKDLKEKDS